MIPKGGMKNIIKKAQELQSQMEKAQEELNSIQIEGQAGGGMVTAKVNGHKELISLEIEPEILKEDKEMIGDLRPFARDQGSETAHGNGNKEIDLYETWDAWNLIRSVCKYSARLSVGKKPMEPSNFPTFIYP